MPLVQCGRAALLESLAIDEAAFGGEMVVPRGVDSSDFWIDLLPESQHGSPTVGPERSLMKLPVSYNVPNRLVVTLRGGHDT